MARAPFIRSYTLHLWCSKTLSESHEFIDEHVRGELYASMSKEVDLSAKRLWVYLSPKDHGPGAALA